MKWSAADCLMIDAGRRATFARRKIFSIVVCIFHRAAGRSEPKKLGNKRSSCFMIGEKNRITGCARRRGERYRFLLPINARGRGAIIESRAQHVGEKSTVIVFRAAIRDRRICGAIVRAIVSVSLFRVPINANGRLTCIIRHAGRRIIGLVTRNVRGGRRRRGCRSRCRTRRCRRGVGTTSYAGSSRVLLGRRCYEKVNYADREYSCADVWIRRIQIHHFRSCSALCRRSHQRPAVGALMNENIVIIASTRPGNNNVRQLSGPIRRISREGYCKRVAIDRVQRIATSIRRPMRHRSKFRSR